MDEEIISKLSDIENSASDILEDTDSEKLKIDEDIAAGKAAWDKALEEDTKQKLFAIRKKSEYAVEKQVADEKSMIESQLSDMEAMYQNFRDDYLESMFEKITKVEL